MKTSRTLQLSKPPADGAPASTPGWTLWALSWADCLALGDGTSEDLLTASAAVDSVEDLTRPGVDVVAVLDPGMARLFRESAGSLFRGASPSQPWLTVLLPWREPPTRTIRRDGMVRSFCCSARVFSKALDNACSRQPESLCYCLMDQVMNGEVEVERLQVKQLPLRGPVEEPTTLAHDAALIMAHRGPRSYLSAALGFLKRAEGASQLAMRVGLDVEDVSEYRDMISELAGVEFYQVDTPPVGPYVIRQALIDRSREHALVFHDSDDVSCYDRLTRLAAEIRDRQVEIVGSHELRLDELERTVCAYRFPLDASAALGLPGSTVRNDRGNEPLLHPTAMIVRSGMVRAGGFSTDRKIANDTQFMLRAYFSLRMRNVDDFLYIRRRHSGALTVAKETALGIPLRKYLGSTWGAAFEAVRSGKAKLEETSLMPHLCPVPHTLTRL